LHSFTKKERRKNEKEEKGKMDAKTKNLNLLLIYMSGWEEDSRKTPGKKVIRAWKGFRYDILNALERENMIRQFRQSLIMTEEGIAKARQLTQQYL
jgi:hypothetical protein